MISREEVKHIAELARLGLKTKEIEKMQKELAVILDYISLLGQADVSGVQENFCSFEFKEAVRTDRAEKECGKTTKSILEQAPLREGDFVKVKGVLQ